MLRDGGAKLAALHDADAATADSRPRESDARAEVPKSLRETPQTGLAIESRKCPQVLDVTKRG